MVLPPSPATLGFVRHEVALPRRLPWWRERTRAAYEWTLDGEPLLGLERDHVEALGDPEHCDSRALALALLGERTGQDVQTPHGDVVVASSCGPQCCPAYSARVETTPTTVVWHDLALRDWWDGEVWGEPVTVTFDRTSYEATLRRLLGELTA